MRKGEKILYAIISGLLLSIPWYEWGNGGIFLLVAFLPFLYLEESISSGHHKGQNVKEVFLYASLMLLVWNICTTWWIKNASVVGLIAAVVVSSFLMSLPLCLYHITKKAYGKSVGYFSFILYWIAFEFIYNFGEVSWPWLTLGNGFLYSTKLVQWFEYTGIFGGSMWALMVNILLFAFLLKIRSKEKTKDIIVASVFVSLIVLIPIVYSLIRYSTYEEKGEEKEIIVVQPNIDAYLKFNDIPSIEQTGIQVRLADSLLDNEVDYVVAPETSINNNIWIDNLPNVEDIKLIDSLVGCFPGVSYVTGITCYKQYNEQTKTNTARKLGKERYYDSFNSSIQIDTSENIPIYHKSKLVVGVEKMPYPGYLKWLKKLTLNLGGTFRSHATQEYREVFYHINDSTGIATAICYESIYGEFVTDFVKEGANLIFIITNDGWWGNTPGHKQHNALARLRAIETRRSIARSANTGISSFINQKGDVLEKLPWFVRGAIKRKLKVNEKLTFYTKYGDYIGRSAFWLSIFLIISLPVRRIVKKL